MTAKEFYQFYNSITNILPRSLIGSGVNSNLDIADAYESLFPDFLYDQFAERYFFSYLTEILNYINLTSEKLSLYSYTFSSSVTSLKLTNNIYTAYQVYLDDEQLKPASITEIFSDSLNYNAFCFWNDTIYFNFSTPINSVLKIFYKEIFNLNTGSSYTKLFTLFSDSSLNLPQSATYLILEYFKYLGLSFLFYVRLGQGLVYILDDLYELNYQTIFEVYSLLYHIHYSANEFTTGYLRTEDIIASNEDHKLALSTLKNFQKLLTNFDGSK